MATPHVAGAAAVLLAQNPGLSPSAVAAALVQTSTTNVVTRAGKGSPNRLLFVG
jgi:subtilisin family serine protease